MMITKCLCEMCLHEQNSDPGVALANVTVQECLCELRQKSTVVLLSLWILSMALGNLGIDEFCTFNQRFNLMPTIQQKFTLIQIAKINKLFRHVCYKTTALKELYSDCVGNAKVKTAAAHMCVISSLDHFICLLARIHIVHKHIVLDPALLNSQPMLRFRHLNTAKSHRAFLALLTRFGLKILWCLSNKNAEKHLVEEEMCLFCVPLPSRFMGRVA